MDEGIMAFFAFRMHNIHIKRTCTVVVIAKQKK